MGKAQAPLTDGGTKAQRGQWVLPYSWPRTAGAQHLWGVEPVTQWSAYGGEKRGTPTHSECGFHPLLWGSVLPASWLALGTL